MNDVIDITPRLLLRSQKACKHEHVTVDEDVAELTCNDCGRALDPWWYIRKLANNGQEWRDYYARVHEQGKELIAKHEAWVVKANETIARLNSEINHLTNVKNTLQNTSVATPEGYARLGNVARRRRRGSR